MGYTALSVVAGYVLALMPKKCSDHVQLELPRFDKSCSTWQCTWSKFSLSFWNCGNTWTWSYCQQNNILSLSNVTQQILIKFVILHSLRCAQHRDRMYPMTSPGYQAIQTQITYGPPCLWTRKIQQYPTGRSTASLAKFSTASITSYLCTLNLPECIDQSSVAQR